jgi:hypothetical protein
MYVFIKPTDLSIRNKGSIVTWLGTIIFTKRRLKSLFFPLNLYFANAYPAIEFKKSEIIVTTTERKTLLKKFLATDNFVRSVSYCERTISSGKNFGGKTLAAPSLINEAESIQMNGIIVMTEVTVRKI